MVLENIFDQNYWDSIEINFSTFYKDTINIPSKPGIYMIVTNTPTNILENLTKINVDGAYDIPKRVKTSTLLPNRLTINQISDEPYCVYIGHQKNLK